MEPNTTTLNVADAAHQTKSQYDYVPAAPAPVMVDEQSARDRDLERRALAAVSRVRNEYGGMQTKVRDAQREIATLEAEVRAWREHYEQLRTVRVAPLRRLIAQKMRSDAGVDPQLKAKLHEVLDLIECMQTPEEEIAGRLAA
jgi:hypothetical protein